MSTIPQILFIVEGEQLEPDVFSQMAKVYGFQCEITSVCMNIHDLYKQLKSEDGFLNVIPILKDMYKQTIQSLEGKTSLNNRSEILNRTKKDLAKLDRSYVFIYLIFDSEFQHDETRNGHEEGTIKDKVIEKCENLREMVEFFNDESDPTKGKLYVNYPMMESYRDCDVFFDKEYRNRFVPLDILFNVNDKKGYKNMVSARKLANIHNKDITQKQFNDLISMNTFKLNYLSTGQWQKMSYEDFRKYSEQTVVLGNEREFMLKNEAVSVLNTSLFFVIDYKGDEFYNDFIIHKIVKV